jgi:hypothetical protein
MPFTFYIDKHAGVIRETWTGPVDLVQLEESCRREWLHPDYDSQLKMISDFREAQAELSADDVLRFASWFSGEDLPPKHAIVVARDTGLTLASAFAMICETVQVHNKSATRLFFSLASAERWLTSR